MHARTADEGGDDPLEVFFDLATLIVEARVPEAAPEGSSGRGYGEGPHCLPYAYRGVAGSSGLGHLCSPDRLHCQRFASLRKHAFLLWQNAVPLCIEVFMQPPPPVFARVSHTLPTRSSSARSAPTARGGRSRRR